VSEADHRTLDAIGPAGHGLRVEFVRIGSRWAHRIWAVQPEASVVLLESVEGEDDQAFPPSPALQQLALQTVASGRVAMLLGMAGQNHWSLAVESCVDSPRVRFDVACRNQPSADAQLGSTYRPQVSWRLAEGGLLVAETPQPGYELALQCSGHTNRAELSRTTTGLVELQVMADAKTATQRWCYELSQRT
jgi:hypothetical protein